MQDHSRSGRLEASTLALRKWLFSDQFERYLSLVQACSLICSLCALLVMGKGKQLCQLIISQLADALLPYHQQCMHGVSRNLLD